MQQSQRNRARPAAFAAASLGLVAWVALGGLGMLACQGGGSPKTAEDATGASPPSTGVPPPGTFDGEQAHADLVKIAGFERRHTGERGAAKARKFIRRALSKNGYSVMEVETPVAANSLDEERTTATHLFARIEGDERDALLLVAPYDARVTPGVDVRGMNAGASGASVLLEIARLEHEALDTGSAPLLAIWLAFVDGDGQARVLLDDSGVIAAVAVAYPGSDAFAAWLAEEPLRERVRLVVFLDRVGDAQLEVARDLHSNRVYREVFFAEAAARGHDEFAQDRPLSAPGAGHRAFVARGIGPVVALVGAPSRPIAVARGDRHDDVSGISSASLFAVGDTTWAGLERLADRLARIDAFRADPLGGSPGDVMLPGAGEAEEPGDVSDPANSTSPSGVAEPSPAGAPSTPDAPL